MEPKLASCCEHIGCSIEGCPACCSGGDCIVLATIEDYDWGDALVEEIDAARQAEIDNRKGRKILASTSAIQRAVECLCAEVRDAGPGEAGPPGDPGQDGTDGADGKGIDQVQVECLPCDELDKAEAEIVEPVIEGDPRLLRLRLPGCCAKDLTRICWTNFRHMERLDSWFPKLPSGPGGQSDFGFAVAFNQAVRKEDLTPITVRVSAPIREQPNEPLTHLVVLTGQVHPVILETRADGDPSRGCRADGIREVNPLGDFVNGVVWLPPSGFDDFTRRREIDSLPLRLEVFGDLIRDAKGRSVDGEHLAPYLPDRASGEGAPGGRFEAWAVGRPNRDINRATIGELASVGVTRPVAEAIVARREAAGGFHSIDELEAIEGVGEATLRKLQERFAALDGEAEPSSTHELVALHFGDRP